eukprot:gene27682-36494_t
MLETRMKFARLVRLSREGYSMNRRRRSFDEAEDWMSGVSSKLGYEIERVRVMATTTELLQDSWLRKDDEPVRGLVSSFRDRRQAEDILTEEDRKLLE